MVRIYSFKWHGPHDFVHIHCTLTSCKETSQTLRAFSKHQYLLLWLLTFLLNVRYASSFTFPHHQTSKSNAVFCRYCIYRSCTWHSWCKLFIKTVDNTLCSTENITHSLCLSSSPLSFTSTCMHVHIQSTQVWKYHTLKCRQHNFRPTCLA